MELRKKCLSCGRSFRLSGSGKPQKYCSECAKQGVIAGPGLPASKPLKRKGAGNGIWTPIPPGESASPIHFTASDGDKGRIWTWEPRTRVKGEEVYWRSAIAEAIRRLPKPRAASKYAKPVDLVNGRLRGHVEQRSAILDTELASPLKGFAVRLVFEDEAPLIGSGYRAVLCQFRGKKVILHYNQPVTHLENPAPITQTLKPEVFKELVASTKQRRKRNPTPALEKAAVRADTPTHRLEPFVPNYTEVVKGDDYPLEYHEDGHAKLPACLDRRKAKLELVVDNTIPKPATEAA